MFVYRLYSNAGFSVYGREELKKEERRVWRKLSN